MRGFSPSAFQRNAFQMHRGDTQRIPDAVLVAAAHAWKAGKDRERKRRREQDAMILGRSYLR